MKSEELTGLLALLDTLTDLLNEYNNVTGSFSQDMELEEFDAVLEKRSELLERMQSNELLVRQILLRLPNDEAKLYEDMLNGEVVVKALSAQEKLIREKILTITSLKNEIVQKDKAVSRGLQAQLDDVKQHLENSHKDRKKLDYYHSIGGSKKGGSLDSHT